MKVFGKISIVQALFVFIAWISVGIIADGFHEEEFLAVLLPIFVLSSLQIVFALKTLKIVDFDTYYSLSVIDDPSSFEGNKLIENTFNIKILGVVSSIAYAILLALMSILFEELIGRMKSVEGSYSSLSDRNKMTVVMFYSILIAFPLIAITIWYNLNMIRTKRLAKKKDN